MVKSENLIHIRFEYEEALNSKRDVLSFERGILRTLKRIKNYHKFRSEELKYKLRVYRKLKELKSNLNKLGKTLPEIEMPEILEKGREEVVPKEKKKKGKDKGSSKNDLDLQLKEIQEKLKSLE